MYIYKGDYMNGTMINISFKLREKLKKIKVYTRETYDETITRMISQQYDEDLNKIKE